METRTELFAQAVQSLRPLMEKAVHTTIDARQQFSRRQRSIQQRASREARRKSKLIEETVHAPARSGLAALLKLRESAEFVELLGCLRGKFVFFETNSVDREQDLEGSFLSVTVDAEEVEFFWYTGEDNDIDAYYFSFDEPEEARSELLEEMLRDFKKPPITSEQALQPDRGGAYWYAPDMAVQLLIDISDPASFSRMLEAAVQRVIQTNTRKLQQLETAL